MLDKRIGILGGGQLGKMLNVAAAAWHLDIQYLDRHKESPVGRFTNQFVEGDFSEYDDVLNFGKNVDILGIEIEHVNTNALRTCKALGKEIFPNPGALDLIKDKHKQFLFVANNNFPIAPFQYFTEHMQIERAIQMEEICYPFVQKSTGLGYDGRGVSIIESDQDLPKLHQGPSVVQKKVDIQKEIAVIVARGVGGEIKIYTPVEMIFDKEANLLDILMCPANISSQIQKRVIELAREVTVKFDIYGLLAVEMFLDMEDQLWINEVAPRPHNSGHHTIESTYTSQYEQYLRCLLSVPLGSTEMITPCAVMLNLVGSKDAIGKANYQSLVPFLNDPKTHIHIYGKMEARPNRKMGHVTILSNSINEGLEKISLIKKHI